jgi:mono/diheme cytochrome c family protein
MRLLAAIGALTVVVAVAGAVYFLGGFYSVAATEPHFDIVAWGLERVREASIKRHSVGAPPISLEDPAIVQAGARAFAERGCVTCHGAPGATWAKFSEALRPDPPDLVEMGKEHAPGELFWAIKNGIKFTGMPGFGLIGVEDKEIWAIVAFVKKLPTVSETDFKLWTAPAH